MTINLVTRKEQKLQLNGNLVTGDTYPVKDFLKQYCGGKWDKASKGWTVDLEKFNDVISRSNHIGLMVDDQPVAAKSTGTASSSGWCNRCKDWCWGDCEG